jgi:hypothetical protein
MDIEKIVEKSYCSASLPNLRSRGAPASRRAVEEPVSLCEGSEELARLDCTLDLDRLRFSRLTVCVASTNCYR